jgi:hypothetical protein
MEFINGPLIGPEEEPELVQFKLDGLTVKHETH